MKQLAWLTDIHLNFLELPALKAFMETLASITADAFVISGDIAESRDLVGHLQTIVERVKRPVYFVLGNHDFYRASITGIRAKIRKLCSVTPNLHWMPSTGVVPLTAETCLIGHDGWSDGRNGDYYGSEVLLNDFGLIEEFDGFFEDPNVRLAKLNALGDEVAEYFRSVLPQVLARFRHVIVVTHIPPFRESCQYAGQMTTDDWLPFMSCKAVGNVLAETMSAAPDRTMTVLCGHTHVGAEAQILANLRALTGQAEYGNPSLQRILDIA